MWWWVERDAGAVREFLDVLGGMEVGGDLRDRFRMFVEISYHALSKRRSCRLPGLLEALSLSDRARMARLLTLACDNLEGSGRDFFGEVAEHIGSFGESFAVPRTSEEVARFRRSLSSPETVQRIERDGYVSFVDPAAGTGEAVLAVAEHISSLGYDPRQALLVEARERDLLSYRMLFLTLTLKDIPARVVHGVLQEAWDEDYTFAYYRARAQRSAA